jgi:hypothetical protein
MDMHKCSLLAVLVSQVVLCFGAEDAPKTHTVQSEGVSTSVAPQQQPEHAVLRKEPGTTMEVSANGDVTQFSAAELSGRCSLNMVQQAARLMLGVSYKDGDIEAGITGLPSKARWTDATMAQCGWTKTLWDDRFHDHIMIAQNSKGNYNGVPPKSCGISFAGSNDDDDWENTNGRKYKDWVEYSKNKSAWTLEKSVNLGKWGEYDIAKGVLEEYENMTASNTAWDTWMSLIASSECEAIFVTGHSLGGGLAQLHYLDLVEKGYCTSKDCYLVPFSPDPIFFGSKIPAADCNKSTIVYARFDPVPQGDPVPVGSAEGTFKEMYGAWIDVKTVNSVVGAERMMLGGNWKGVWKKDFGADSCSKSTYGREYFPVTDKDESYEKGANIELMLGMTPWHMANYIVYMTDAYFLDLPDFFFSWKAIVSLLEGLFQHFATQGGDPKEGIMETLDISHFYNLKKKGQSEVIQCLHKVYNEWIQLKQGMVEHTPVSRATAKITQHFNMCLPKVA